MSVGIRKAVKRFGDAAAVDGTEVEIATGEFFVVLGPSGCGKSTLLRLIAGLDRLDSGEIALDGAVVSGGGVHVAPEERRTGFVFQSYALWPHMSVLDNVAFPIETAGASRTKARAEAMAHLKTVALEPFADRQPAALSGGQRQRVALARCLAGGAQTVLMDEPLANLDPHLRGLMEEELARFHTAAGATTVYITHDQREAMALASRIAVMQGGRFLQVGTPEEIHDRPVSAEVARFIGRAAVVSAIRARTNAGPVLRLGPLEASVSAGREGRVEAVLRPGDVRLGDGDVQGRVASAAYRGGVWEGRIAVEGLDETLPVASPRPLRVGELVPLSLSSAWVLPEA